MNDYLDRLETQLTQLTEQGAHKRLRARGVAPVRRRTGAPRPPRRGSEALAFLAAAAVVAAVVAIVLVNAHSGRPQRTSSPATHSQTETTSSTATHSSTVSATPAPGTVSLPIPANFHPQSFTAISELAWWLLGSAPECTFRGEQPPCGAILRTTNGGRSFVAIDTPRVGLSTYSQLRFADAKNGFAYGPDLQSASGGGPGTDLLVSQDGDGGFSRQPVPSPGLPCDLQAQSPQVIWAHCVTGTESGVWHSSDYITGFTRVPGAGLPSLPNSAVFAAASDTTAVVGYQQLYQTTDSGTRWAPVGPSGIAQWTYLGFTDPTHGVALGYAGSVAPVNERLYYTTDGGQTYHRVPLP